MPEQGEGNSETHWGHRTQDIADAIASYEAAMVWADVDEAAHREAELRTIVQSDIAEGLWTLSFLISRESVEARRLSMWLSGDFARTHGLLPTGVFAIGIRDPDETVARHAVLELDRLARTPGALSVSHHDTDELLDLLGLAEASSAS